jgi:hypothetical protein
VAPGCLKQTQGDRIPENPEFVTARTESGSSSTGGEERKGEKEALRSGAQSSVGERRGRRARRCCCGLVSRGSSPFLFIYFIFCFPFPKHFSQYNFVHQQIK